MKKVILVLIILLLVISLFYVDVSIIDYKGMLCKTPIATVYHIVSDTITDVLQQFGLLRASEADYIVTVVDGMGNPISDIIVKFTGPDGKTKTRVTDKTGVAGIFGVPGTDYTVVLDQGFSSAIIDDTKYHLSVDERTMTIEVRDSKRTMDIAGDVVAGSYAYVISDGSYEVKADKSGEAYYVFTARSSGIYKISIAADNSATTVGYYGIPMFVQSTHRGDGEYDGRSFEVIIQDNQTPYVIGVKNCTAGNVVLTVERIGEAPFDPEFVPWVQMTKEADIDKCVIPTGVNLKNVDVTDPDFSVSLGEDGLYYTDDGKLVYIKITGTNETYLPGASLAYLAGFVDNQIGMNIGGYIYDNGEFVEKRNYNLMIKDYMSYCDSEYGVVPLTEELAECIRLHGESTGWWNSSAGNYLFSGVDLVVENAWLFLCMVEE